jgi:hypothetical protein
MKKIQSNKVPERNPAIADLDVEHNELAQTWRSFVWHLLPEDTVEWEERPQTPQDVQALVRNLQSLWASRPRRRVFRFASSLCDRFLPTVETHATLLATLPDSDTYHGPLFYGVLQSVLKVSSIHSYGTLTEG